MDIFEIIYFTIMMMLMVVTAVCCLIRVVKVIKEEQRKEIMRDYIMRRRSYRNIVLKPEIIIDEIEGKNLIEYRIEGWRATGI